MRSVFETFILYRDKPIHSALNGVGQVCLVVKTCGRGRETDVYNVIVAYVILRNAGTIKHKPRKTRHKGGGVHVSV